MKALLKLFSIVFVIVLAVNVAGCQSKVPAPTEVQPPVTSAETQPPAAAEPVTVHILTMDQAAMSTDEEEEIARAFEAENPGIKIQWEFVGYDSVHDKFVTGMASTPPAYDAVMVDVVWPDEFIKAGYLLDVTDRITTEMKAGIFPSAWLGVTRNDKVYGMPWLMDNKYFFYNKDILEQAGFAAPPKTWEELVSQAEVIKSKGLAEFPIVWSWIQAEAAICDFTALLYGNDGKFLDDAGKPAFNNDKGVATLAWMKKTLDDGISNPSSPIYKEGDVETAFLAGKAAFGLNWLSMYSNAQDATKSTVVGKVGIAPIPVFEGSSVPSSSVDGSSAFSVTATSPNKDAAWKFLVYLSSEAVQMKYSAKQLPIWKAAFEGSNLTNLENATTIGPVTVPAFLAQFPYANERPTVAYYNEASAALQLAIQDVLTGKKNPQEALDAAAAKWVELAGK
ncbi:MAG: extracellular solute-binding protein [Anaerolineaceae bacterium]